MRKWQVLKSQKGFSLVELMVVVAIIGVLAVIGIPQYQKFMSKARQAEAKSHLNGIFQGEAAFFTEYNEYTTGMPNIGAGATGVGLRYNAGFTITACTAYSVANGAPANGVAGNNTLIDVAAAGTTWFYGAANVADIAAGATACDATAGASTYISGAWGNPTNTVQGANNNADQFTINHLRNMTNIAVGI